MSDLHGRLPKIPKADLLLIVGDICPDPSMRVTCGDPDMARILQTEWMNTEYRAWEQDVPVERIIGTPGNHDWIARAPEGCRTELFIDELVEWRGKRFWLTPWVNFCGDWNYQLPRTMRQVRFAEIPFGLDILASHSPAHKAGDLAYGDVPAGCEEMRQAVLEKKPRFMVYGHIHEAQRYGRVCRLGQTELWCVSMWGDRWEPVILDI